MTNNAKRLREPGTPCVFDVRAASVGKLLAGYGAILEQLREREIVRSSNNPVSDYSELLFCRAFGWQRENNSTAGYDAKDRQGIRYQIKGRRLARHNRSRQLNIERKPFDKLAGLLMDETFQVIRAAIIPFSVVRDQTTYSAHANYWRFLLRDQVWDAPGVRDVTNVFCEAARLY